MHFSLSSVILLSHCLSLTQKHTCTHNLAYWILSATTRISQYQKKHSPSHTYCRHQSSLICFIRLLRFMASSLFNLHTWQSSSTISLQVFFGLPLGLAPPLHTPYISSPNQCLLFAAHAHTISHSLFCCSTEIMSSKPSLSLNPLLRTLSYGSMRHIHLTILILAC